MNLTINFPLFFSFLVLMRIVYLQSDFGRWPFGLAQEILPHFAVLGKIEKPPLEPIGF